MNQESRPVGAENPTSPAGAPSGILSCVLDERQPEFDLEIFRWYASLTALAAVSPADLRVKVVGATPSRVLDQLRRRGVGVSQIPRFDERHPPCNKVGGALALGEEAGDELCVLTDSDVVFFEDPRTIAVPADQVAMRPVDLARPSLEVLCGIFDRAGVTPPPTVAAGWQEDASTLAGNGNGGFYLIPGPLLGEVARGWARWSTWLLDRDLLPRRGDRVLCVDQVAMALTLAAEGIGVFEIDPSWNLPTHIPTPGATVPAMIHYHRATSTAGDILMTGIAAVDECISRANQVCREAWREAFGPRTTILADASELTAAPELLRRYCHRVDPSSASTLAIVADDDDLSATFQRLSVSLRSVGIDPEQGPEMVIVAASSDLSTLAAEAVLTGSDALCGQLALPRWRG